MLLFALVVSAGLSSCPDLTSVNGEADSSTPPHDAARDGAADAGVDAASISDARRVESGIPDSGRRDAALGDATRSDGAATDLRQTDTAFADAGDPPVPTAPCGTDLDVHNGTVHPEFGVVPSGPIFTGDPIALGPLAILAVDATLPNPDSSRDSYSVTTYAPSTDGANPDPGPFPLVVFTPGFSTTHRSYRHFIDHFASHGIAVLGVTPAQVGFFDEANNPANVGEVRAAIEWALVQSPLAGKIDLDKIATAGHSQGGKLAFFTAAEDTRIKIVIGYDPQNGGGPPCFINPSACNQWPVAPNCDTERGVSDSGLMYKIRAETLVLAARDTLVTPDQHLWAEHFYRGAPAPAHLAVFLEAGHADWTGSNATSDASKRVGLALLLTRFKGVSGLDSYLPDGSYLAGLPDMQIHNK
ncbi:MAG: hypothetical protein JXR83_17335 [Deltaproteobacteria bacterium]|nr:hypothetical protein [Deltaproteobacteria bacterium]